MPVWRSRKKQTCEVEESAASRPRRARLRSDAGRVLLLAAMVLLIAVTGIAVSRIVSARMLRADAESTSSNWATSLSNSTDIPALIKGTVPSDKTAHLLNGAAQIGDVYRYSIRDRNGQLVFAAERLFSSGPPLPMHDQVSPKIAASVLSGRPFTRSASGDGVENPAYYSISFIPLMKDGAAIGVLQIYLDQTADRAFYQKFLFLTEGCIALVVLLAGGLPVYLIYRNLSAQRAAQAKAQFLAAHDGLTGLLNRKRIVEAATNALAWSRRNKTQIAILLLDLDKFTEINDTFGHAAGDELLRFLAQRIQTVTRKEDLLARVEGDEFVVLQVGVEQPGGAAHLAERLLNVLAKPQEIGNSTILCRASIGVAIAPSDGQEWDKLFSCADAALRKSKASGRNTVSFFEPGMDAAIRQRWLLEVDLQRALETRAFRLAYQPVYGLRDRALLGFEALLRWPEGWAPKFPAEFIPVAEECGLIRPIGAWALNEACKTAAAWKAPLRVAVNLSPVQFRTGNIVDTVREALEASGLAPIRLELEVTEGIWIQNTEVVLQRLKELRAMGVSIALDDFGTGYSSLSYLWRFPFDKVKIDRSLVVGMQADHKATAIVNTIVGLGKALDLTTTAEGVENPQQAEALIAAGCDQVQGYLFGRPILGAAVDELIEKERSARFSARPVLQLRATGQMSA